MRGECKHNARGKVVVEGDKDKEKKQLKLAPSLIY